MALLVATAAAETRSARGDLALPTFHEVFGDLPNGVAEAPGSTLGWKTRSTLAAVIASQAGTDGVVEEVASGTTGFARLEKT